MFQNMFSLIVLSLQKRLFFALSLIIIIFYFSERLENVTMSFLSQKRVRGSRSKANWSHGDPFREHFYFFAICQNFQNDLKTSP